MEDIYNAAIDENQNDFCRLENIQKLIDAVKDILQISESA